jgi:hypothetical protein
MTAGEIMMELAADLDLDATSLHVFQDLAGVLDLEESLAALTDHDRRGVIAQVMGSIVMADDFEELMLRKADWIATTEEGGAPCNDAQAVADGIRRVVLLLRS